MLVVLIRSRSKERSKKKRSSSSRSCSRSRSHSRSRSRTRSRSRDRRRGRSGSRGRNHRQRYLQHFRHFSVSQPQIPSETVVAATTATTTLEWLPAASKLPRLLPFGSISQSKLCIYICSVEAIAFIVGCWS